jgi:hypothetical protein
MSAYYDQKKRIMKQPAGADDKCIRVLLEPGTVVMVKNLHSYANWKSRYPDARILDVGGEHQEFGVDQSTSVDSTGTV